MSASDEGHPVDVLVIETGVINTSRADVEGIYFDDHHAWVNYVDGHRVFYPMHCVQRMSVDYCGHLR